ncbi:phosphoglycerate mutase [Pseudalkalibacillus caeni]|uniref:Phosphoglycerate mutase n=1 Tax=Exobacillus caeni TaxID=2574798 RepID=A0A5R9FD11_9BACL|nr:phosphoglycerate mutase [Pseudalkalibacillus caeni]TLS38444.1 phosphoglycerate mutase [Pseudalkalibacillus caeni]
MDENEEIDIFNKEGIKTDLALINTCLKIINHSITVNKGKGDDFSAPKNEELHLLVSRVSRNLNRIKGNIQWSEEN